jgi:signal transduction histidine kinase
VVADDGPSLEEEERRHLVDPRAQRPGAGAERQGVGLKLAQVIATGHQGSLSLHDNHPGLRVDVVLPLTLTRRTDRPA